VGNLFSSTAAILTGAGILSPTVLLYRKAGKIDVSQSTDVKAEIAD
jgi:hypothetical protein